MKSRQIPEKAKHFVVNYGEEAIKTLMTYDPELPKNPILKLFTPKPPGRYEFTRQFAKDVLAALPPEEISNEIRFAAYMCDWKKVKFMLEIGADPKYLRNYKIPDKYLPFLENNTAKRTVNADPPAAYYSAAYSPTAYHLARDIPSTDHFSALTDSQSKVNTAAKLTKMQLSVPPASFYPGLDNVGNTCYLNSVIQTLFHLERFRSVVLTSRPAENSLAKGLQHLFREMQNFRNNEREVASWNPFRFVSLVSRLWTGQQTYAPNDATEFMKWLLSNVHEDTGGQVNVTAFFQGLMRTEINCIGVECQSISYGHFLEIPLPFGNHPFRLGPVISLKEMVKNYFAVEYLTGENQYDSEIFGRRDAKKHNVIVSLPPVLSIHLLRFYVDAWNEISKVKF
jgi:hypothetical protein